MPEIHVRIDATFKGRDTELRKSNRLWVCFDLRHAKPSIGMSHVHMTLECRTTISMSVQPATGRWGWVPANLPSYFPQANLALLTTTEAVQAAYPGAGPDQPDGLAHTQRSSLVRPRIDRVWTAQ